MDDMLPRDAPRTSAQHHGLIRLRVIHCHSFVHSILLKQRTDSITICVQTSLLELRWGTLCRIYRRAHRRHRHLDLTTTAGYNVAALVYVFTRIHTCTSASFQQTTVADSAALRTYRRDTACAHYSDKIPR